MTRKPHAKAIWKQGSTSVTGGDLVPSVCGVAEKDRAPSRNPAGQTEPLGAAPSSDRKRIAPEYASREAQQEEQGESLADGR
jgi:hypothetical protein